MIHHFRIFATLPSSSSFITIYIEAPLNEFGINPVNAKRNAKNVHISNRRLGKMTRRPNSSRRSERLIKEENRFSLETILRRIFLHVDSILHT